MRRQCKLPRHALSLARLLLYIYSSSRASCTPYPVLSATGKHKVRQEFPDNTQRDERNDTHCTHCMPTAVPAYQAVLYTCPSVTGAGCMYVIYSIDGRGSLVTALHGHFRPDAQRHAEAVEAGPHVGARSWHPYHHTAALHRCLPENRCSSPLQD